MVASYQSLLSQSLIKGHFDCLQTTINKTSVNICIEIFV